jgi:hypothetical protein
MPPVETVADAVPLSDPAQTCDESDAIALVGSLCESVCAGTVVSHDVKSQLDSLDAMQWSAAFPGRLSLLNAAQLKAAVQICGCRGLCDTVLNESLRHLCSDSHAPSIAGMQELVHEALAGSAFADMKPTEFRRRLLELELRNIGNLGVEAELAIATEYYGLHRLY